jgi:hypothetical protein
MRRAGLDYPNGPGAGELDAASCGSVLRSLAEVQAKFTAAHASVRARFDAADAHDSDGWHLGCMADGDDGHDPRRRKAEVRQMRLLRSHRPQPLDIIAVPRDHVHIAHSAEPTSLAVRPLSPSVRPC